MKRTALSSILIGVVLALLSAAAPPVSQTPSVTAASGMVASAHPLASQAGLAMLKAGGNAVDAAIAAAFAIGVAEPNASGIGGEGLMVIALPKAGISIAVDYRSTAPSRTALTKSLPSTGPDAVSVPGAVAGLCQALEKYGTMKRAEVFAPAIKMAAEGFAISPTLASIIKDNYEEILKDKGLARIFCPGDLPLEPGETLKNPELAESLAKIAAGGQDVFYRGELADAIAADLKDRGGFLSKDDLAAYRAVERPPIRGSYRGYDLVSAPPPVGGLAVVETLHILENFDVSRMDPLSPERIHLMAEAMKRGAADWRAFVGDPDFVRVPVAGLLARPYAKARAAEISLERISEKIGAGEPDGRESPSTTSLSTVDKDGNMVALTQTISDFFGAKIMIAGTGIILNNEMKNFSAGGPNALAAGRRMRTTIAPTLVVKDGRAFATLGTPGAARILTTMPLLISNLIDYKMGIQEAIERPRFFPGDKELSIEPRLPAETVAALSKLGYTLKPMGEFDLFFGGAQGILIDPKTGLRIGGADPRRDGAVVGY
jgi:gamma-glutamyltranspeptidase/glutathione hydrolase